MKKVYVIIVLVIALSSGLFARTITGVVTDNSGNALPGVNVLLRGTHNGTITNAEGKFTIGIPEGKATLVFSYVGFKQLEVVISGPGPLAVIMIEEPASLNEVVVTGYATHKRSDNTGAVSIISNDSRAAERQSKSYAPCNSCPGSGYYYPAPEPNRESYASIHENGYKNPLKDPLSTFSIDVDAASYSNVRRFINEGQKPDKDAVRIEEMINYFDYDYPQPRDGNPFSIVYELGECPWNRNNMLLHIGLQGDNLVKNEIPPSNLVFLIDVSGSMDSPNKLPLLVKAFKMLVGQLRSSDRVAIVVYAGSSGLVLPSTPGTRKDLILGALDRLQAGGSTAGAEGLKLAYEVAENNFQHDGNNRIILATDGDFNVGPSSNEEMEKLIEKYRNKGIFMSVMGFGMGNVQDDKMEIIADKGNGNYSYIDNLMEARKVFINEFSSTLYTIAKDVKIQIEFNPVFVKEYRLVGYENRILNEEDFEDDKKDAGELGAGHSVTALYELIPSNKPNDYVRKLKYQQTEILPGAPDTRELATIKFRYKKPDGDKSILMTEIIPHVIRPVAETSDNFRFSAAVAGFGMILRESEFKGNIDCTKVLNLARASKGRDEDGYRSEFIRLVELSNDQWAMNEE